MDPETHSPEFTGEIVLWDDETFTECGGCGWHGEWRYCCVDDPCCPNCGRHTLQKAEVNGVLTNWCGNCDETFSDAEVLEDDDEEDESCE
jgi:hypothetical protein